MKYKIRKIKGKPKHKIHYNKWAEVEIPEAQIPEAKLKRWGNECFIKMKYNDFHPVSPRHRRGKIRWQNSDKEVHLYPLEPTDHYEEGGFEFEIIEKKKITPKIVLDLELHNVIAYYQPPLTEEFKNGWSDEFQREIIVTETTVKDLDGNIWVHRPEKIVGSYVFYHATKGNIHPISEVKKYETSQIGFLYRPKIIDSAGNWIWGKQKIKNRKLTTTIPQDFIDKAVYPIKHSAGAEFGYHTIGGSSAGWSDDTIRIYQKDSPANAGDVTEVSIYCSSNDPSNPDTIYYRGVVYLDSDKSRVTYGSENSFTGKFDERDWRDASVTSASIDTVDYDFGIWFGDGNISANYNSITGYNYLRDNETYHSTNAPPDPFSIDTTYSNRKASIYCTYTPAAGGGEMSLNTKYWGPAI